ncbi:cytochrome P450 [Streptomyces subrutilus]|uniref:cytochrome P450 n=1 Tax=Streptomyces subrutilus TaxID=36818 RepID=UPI0033D36531
MNFEENPLRIVSGPRGLPLLGVVPPFGRDPLAFLTGLRDDFGDAVTWSTGPRRWLFLSHPAHISEMLAAKERTFKIIEPGWAFQHVAGHSVVVSAGNTWRRKRALVQPAVRPRNVRAHARTMINCAEELTDQWHDGQHVDARAQMSQLARRVVLRTLFGEDLDDTKGQLRGALDTAERVVGEEVRSISQFFPGWMPTTSHRRLRRATAEIDREVLTLIEARRALAAAHRAGPDDLVDRLLEARDEAGRPLTAKETRDEAVTMWAVGQETISTTLSWTWHLLSASPGARSMLEAELDRVLKGRAPAIEDYEHLTVTRQIIREVLRLYPPLWLLPSVAGRDATLAGVSIPSGTVVCWSPWVTQRDPRWFPDAAEFRPERWHPNRPEREADRAWFPFGSGPRACLGAHFALTTATLLVATIAQRFRLEIPTGPAALRLGLLLRPASPQTATLHRRETHHLRSARDDGSRTDHATTARTP